MAQLIDKAALVAEIENKIKKYTKRGEESDAKHDGYGMYWGGVLSCLNEIRTLCDSLEEPVSEDLEEEINKYIGHPQQADEDIDITVIRQAARHFAKWQKQQIMKDDVDLVIEDASFVNLKIDGIKKDDKVKIIIIKEE